MILKRIELINDIDKLFINQILKRTSDSPDKLTPVGHAETEQVFFSNKVNQVRQLPFGH